MGRSNDRTPGRCGQGRGGRGGSRTSYNPTNTNKRKTIEDYLFYVGSHTQASDFETTYEFVLDHIKRIYTPGNDILESLRSLEAPDTHTWNPNLVVSISTDYDEKKRETRQFELDYKAEYDEFMRRKREFNENSVKVYAELRVRYNKPMQGNIEARTDFQSRVYNNHIELLKAIK